MAVKKTKSLAEKANSPKSQASAERSRAATLGAGEPFITLENYNTDIANAFSYYNNFVEDKDKRKWVQKYLGKDKESLEKLSNAADHEIRQVATLIRLAERGQPLAPVHTTFINEKLDKVLNGNKITSQLAPEKIKSVVDKPIVSIQDRIAVIASGFISDVEHEIDMFILNKKSEFSMKDYIATNQINGPTAKVISKWFKKYVDEVTEALEGNDEQLVEAYSHLKNSDLKKFHKMLTSIVDECVQQKVNVVRKARKVKIKPATEVVKRVKYMQEFTDGAFTLKSEHPVKLVNSVEVWLYNAKTRRATVLRAVDNGVLVVKGTSIINFDIGRSDTRTLRKPDEFFATKLAKRELAAAWKLIKTKVAPAKGRIGEDVVIVAAFA